MNNVEKTLNRDESLWDCRAEIWDAVEHFGFGISDLKTVERFIDSPVLIVGAGQGLIMEELLSQGHVVAGIDSSTRMIERARERRQLDISYANAESLPFSSGAFRSVVFTTGTLYPKSPLRNSRCISESRRVTCDGGGTIIAFQSLSENLFRVANSLGYVQGSQQHHDRVVELWDAKGDLQRCAELVSQWTMKSYEDAWAVVKEFHWAIEGISNCLNEVVQILNTQGQNATRFIRHNDLFGYDFFSQNEILRALISWNFEIHFNRKNKR